MVIGGYESGMDAAYNIACCGKKCTVVSSTAFWRVTTDDPSTELAPYTAERVREARAEAPVPPRLLAPLRVFKVEPASGESGESSSTDSEALSNCGCRISDLIKRIGNFTGFFSHL